MASLSLADSTCKLNIFSGFLNRQKHIIKRGGSRIKKGAFNVWCYMDPLQYEWVFQVKGGSTDPLNKTFYQIA